MNGVPANVNWMEAASLAFSSEFRSFPISKHLTKFGVVPSVPRFSHCNRKPKKSQALPADFFKKTFTFFPTSENREKNPVFFRKGLASGEKACYNKKRNKNRFQSGQTERTTTMKLEKIGVQLYTIRGFLDTEEQA